MKKIILLLVIISFKPDIYAQSITQKEIKNKKLTYILNNIEKITEGDFQGRSENGFFARIYSVDNPSGSAGGESDEVTTSIYITTSGYGEYPEQHLFHLSSVYNPRFGQFKEVQNGLEITLTYGDEPPLTILINLKKVIFKK